MWFCNIRKERISLYRELNHKRNIYLCILAKKERKCVRKFGVASLCAAARFVPIPCTTTIEHSGSSNPLFLQTSCTVEQNYKSDFSGCSLRITSTPPNFVFNYESNPYFLGKINF